MFITLIYNEKNLSQICLNRRLNYLFLHLQVRSTIAPQRNECKYRAMQVTSFTTSKFLTP